MLNSRLKRFPFIKQRDMTECGTTCLAMIFKYYGLYNIQSSLRELANVDRSGTDLYTLSEIGTHFGFTCDGYQLSYENLEKIALPCIAHYEGNHFVIVYKVSSSHVWIADPAFGKDKLTRKDFESRWNGIVLEFKPGKEIFKHPDVEELVKQQKQKELKITRDFYLSLLHPFKKLISIILLASLVLQLLGLALPFFTQAIIDQVLVNDDRQLLFIILAGMIFVFGIQVMLSYARNIMVSQFKVHFELDFFSRLFDHLIHLPQSYFDAHKREDFINRFQENLKIRKLFSPPIIEAFLDVIFVLNYLIILFFYSRLLAGIAFFFVAVFLLLVIIYTPRLRQLENKVFHENLKTMGDFLDTLLGMLSVKLLSIEKIKFWKWKNTYKRALNKVFDTEQTLVYLQSFHQSLFFLSHVVVYWVGAYLAFTGSLSIGQYVAFVSIFSLVMVALQNMGNLWFIVTEVSVSHDRLNDIFIQEREKTDISQQIRQLDNFDIRFENVSFSYNPSADHVLNNISIKIKPSQFVAIAGRNGSGKTTLVKLMLGLYPNYEGNISIGGIDLPAIHPHTLRKKLFLMPQDIYIFSGTIKENIQYARPGARMDQIVEAAKKADLHSFIKKLYLGYNHKVGQDGSNLSGGQRLKLAFARLFLSTPEVIILDESSSVLDVESEKIILNNVKNHFAGKTIISIAHRLNTIRNADCIYVLDEGIIAEYGSHKQLMEQQGLYHTFMQSYVNF